jgi:uncharacterized membrane protein YidH (DUF202 family)
MEILRISQESLLREEPFKRLSKNFFLSIYYIIKAGLGITGLNRLERMMTRKTYLQTFVHYFVLLALQHHVKISVIHDCDILLRLA